MSLPQIPESLWALLAEVGPRWASDIKGHSRRVVEAFSALHSGAPKVGAVLRNLAYGEHPRQVLDLYVPPGSKGVPMVVFVHGGAFVDGEKDRTPEVYSNVCWFFARNGLIGVNLEYRLAPEFLYPAATQDVGQAVAWLRAHAAQYGGDPDRIFLMGHSAGAAHVGNYAYNPRFRPAGETGIAGLILLSGRVRSETLPENPNAAKVGAYYGGDPKLMEDGSLVPHVSESSPPTLIGVAEFENPLIDVHSAELVHRIAWQRRRAPRHFQVLRHNHTSIVAQINTADDVVGPQILDFIARPA